LLPSAASIPSFIAVVVALFFNFKLFLFLGSFSCF
jgi:hypothetical protein